MQKQISPKIIALTFGILVVCFAIVFYVLAWQEPTETPPEGNVPSPLNVGPDAQEKLGTLKGDDILLGNTGGAVAQGGDLELYNSTGTKMIALDGDSGQVIIDNVTIRGDWKNEAENLVEISDRLNADRLDDYHAADLMAGDGGGGGWDNSDWTYLGSAQSFSSGERKIIGTLPTTAKEIIAASNWDPSPVPIILMAEGTVGNPVDPFVPNFVTIYRRYESALGKGTYRLINFLSTSPDGWIEIGRACYGSDCFESCYVTITEINPGTREAGCRYIHTDGGGSCNTAERGWCAFWYR